ncbi:hypothetical protein BOX15_Mlig003044g1 [Macrostomum lignano]|uniref:LIM zinc-binding domain-containing protein n=1 Tax=Macrostomum lignano TaxID=282301 RepID=A0A267GS96_9PLAT|nr:hypothetical protein BOX15_Mlig003044g1 [Macrostomum lignano]
MPFKAPETEKCVRCTKSVYAAERMEAGGRIWHKMCFRCKECDMKLNLNNYAQNEGTLYCKTHYNKMVVALNSQTPNCA